ncbi:MAG: hypothetical protein H6559_08505 [Lewinellaceae bacterium]|nr:hypothetical protein [Lewinellaceae bacterium]
MEKRSSFWWGRPCVILLSDNAVLIDINRDSLIEELKNAPGNSEVHRTAVAALSESYAKDVPDEAILFGEELIRQATLLGSPELLYRVHILPPG